MTTETWTEHDVPYPSGAIVCWYGKLNDIPPGWMLCDGNNGTPDLRGRFIRGVADATTDPGTTGGQDSLTLSTSQLPNHSHSGRTSNDGEHNHSVNVNTNLTDGDSDAYAGGTTNMHRSTTDGSHSHNLDGSVGDAGGGASINNEPRHVEVAFIQKT